MRNRIEEEIETEMDNALLDNIILLGTPMLVPCNIWGGSCPACHLPLLGKELNSNLGNTQLVTQITSLVSTEPMPLNLALW